MTKICYDMDLLQEILNTIYEVKSAWTYKKDIEDIPLKKQGCIDAGYLYVLCVYNNKGILEEQNIKIDNIDTHNRSL